MYLSPNVRAFWFRWVADPVWMTPSVGPMFPFPEHTCSRDDGVSPRMGLVIRLNFRRCVFVNTCFRTCIRLEFSKLCTFKNMPITTSMSWQHPFLNVMQICLFACPLGLLPIRFGVPAEPVGENERKRTFPLLLLFGSCLIAHESPNEHWPFMVQRMQFPFSVRLSFARSSHCKSHLEMRTLHFLFKMSLNNYLQSAKCISCRRMSPLVCRLVTHIPTRQLLKFTSCTDSPICCQWLLTLLRPTVCRKLERGRYLLEHSINISSPTWLHWRDSFWRSRRSSKQYVSAQK